jgi:hypothetical protein
MVTPTAVLRASPEQVSCDLDGETVLLNLKSGTYYGLNPVAARVWALLQQPRTAAEVCAAVLDQYAVDPDRCRRDVGALLEKFVAEGLVEVHHA